MAFKGTLKDFSVADIFQLISQQGKSGSLCIRTGVKEAQIVFDGGKVVLGTFKRSDEDFLLGTMLLRARIITTDQLTQAIENQKTTLRSLGDILKTMGAINTTILSEFVSLQLKEVLFRIFQWSEGLYEFVPEKIQYNRAVIHPQSTEAVLMDGYRMLDEWPRVLEKVGSTESVYRSLTDAEALLPPKSEEEKLNSQLDDAFPPYGDKARAPRKDQETENEMTPAHRTVLSLLDGKRSLQEVIYLSRLGTFDAMKSVADLLAQGLIEKITELAPTRVSDEYAERAALSVSAWAVSNFRMLLSVFVVSVAFPVVAFGVRSNFASRFTEPGKGIGVEARLSMDDLRGLTDRARLSNLLDLYYLRNAEYPLSLAELGDPQLAAEWEYRRGETRYQLTYRPSAP